VALVDLAGHMAPFVAHLNPFLSTKSIALAFNSCPLSSDAIVKFCLLPERYLCKGASVPYVHSRPSCCGIVYVFLLGVRMVSYSYLDECVSRHVTLLSS